MLPSEVEFLLIASQLLPAKVQLFFLAAEVAQHLLDPVIIFKFHKFHKLPKLTETYRNFQS